MDSGVMLSIILVVTIVAAIVHALSASGGR